MKFLLFVSAALLWLSPVASAQTIVMTIAADPDRENHYPGPDGFIGNADDVVSGALTTVQSSAPNANGSLGHNAFSFGGFGQVDPALPVGFDAITFVNGTVTVDTGVLTSGGGPIVSALNITSGTEPFPGHGAYTSTITAVNGGTYNPATGDFTLDVNISYLIFGNPGTEPGVVLTGTAIYRTSDEFGTPTGNAYVDNVAVPLAQAAGASSMVFMTGTGMLTNLGYPIMTSLVALDVGSFQINSGLNDAWVNLDILGQGFFINVFPVLQRIFMAMFTYDTVLPPEDVTAILGGPGQRWLTAFGGWEGNIATLDIELTTGGIFNSGVPEPEQSFNYGTFTVEFIDCNNAIITYSIPSLGLNGVIPVSRATTDNVALCQALNGP